MAQEHAVLEEAVRKEAPVIPPVPGSLRIYEDSDNNGGGFLLAEIGEPFTVTSKAECADAFSALAVLHSKGVTHGDARLPNLLRCRDGLRWIDLARFNLNLTDPLNGDVRLLATTILGLDRVSLLPDHVKAAIEQYVATSQVSVEAVVDAVWAARTAAGKLAK